ncbi:AAA family ATPase [Streptomyces acidiscabies]|uniref:AAA family ATPase n=1 Tax=Streptomyces acidiscabies TaxID=42234 RepID=UPI00095C57FD|nr:AAA family ATPase [Streptomyces acidiscabies]GAV44872.1 putative HTH-type transcriptional [Streptomyces acidiscabies]
MAASGELFVPNPSPLAGRGAELGVLRDAWRRTLRLRPTVVVVEGAPGIGKSALVGAFLKEAAPPLVARSYGDEAWERRPWEVLRQVVQELPGARGGELTEEADPALVARALAEDLGRVGPVVVVVDDAHWGDRASMTALRLAARSLRNEPVLLVLAHVPIDAAVTQGRSWGRAHEGLHEGWRRLIESGEGDVVRLEGLSADALLRLAPSWGQPRLSPSGAAHLHELTGGNPLHARQLLQQVAPHALAYGQGPLPAHRSMPLTLISRLGSCAPATRDLVAAGAVLGRRFLLAQARELAGLRVGDGYGGEVTGGVGWGGVLGGAGQAEVVGGVGSAGVLGDGRSGGVPGGAESAGAVGGAGQVGAASGVGSVGVFGDGRSGEGPGGEAESPGVPGDVGSVEAVGGVESAGVPGVAGQAGVVGDVGSARLPGSVRPGGVPGRVESAGALGDARSAGVVGDVESARAMGDVGPAGVVGGVGAVGVGGSAGAPGMGGGAARGAGGDVGEALDEAVRAGLLVEVPGTGGRTLAFPNGVIGDYVYSDMSPGRRRQLHRAAAEFGGPDALWHRIAADQGQNEDVALAAEREARRQLSLGNLRLAAVYAGHALELTPPGPHVRARLLTAVETLLVSGDASTARRYEGELTSLTPGPWVDYVNGYLVLLGGRIAEARGLFLRALEGVRAAGRATPVEGSPLQDHLQDHETPAPPSTTPADLEARIATQLAIIGVVQLDYQDMVFYGEAAVAAPTQEPWVRAFAWFAKTVGTALAGDADKALRELRTVHLPGAPAGLDGLVARGMIRLWTDDLDGAHADLGSAVERATRGEPLRIGQGLGFLGEAEYRRGNLAEAVRLTASAIGDAAENGRVWDYPLLYALACYPLAAQGSWEEAARHAREATDWSQLLASPMSFAFAAGARAAIAQAAEDHEGFLDAAEAIETHYSSREPGAHLFGPVRADALSRLGRTAEAAHELAEFVARTREVDRVSAHLAVARVRAQISEAEGEPAAALASCEEALTLAKEAGLPLEGARVRLVTARQLSALGRGLAAEAALREALHTFTACGAHAYEAQTRRLAADLGLSLTGPVSALAALTPREREAVRLMRTGLSNQGIARRLGVAQKTVETHLQHAYDKLHLSRDQLRALKLDG